METAAPPKRRSAIWIVLLIVAAILLAAGGYVLFIWSQLGTTPDGTRVTFVLPAGGAHSSIAGPLPVAVAAELRNQGINVEHHGLEGGEEVDLFLRREKWVAHLTLTAGGQPVDVSRLGYVLHDKDGKEVGAGALRPDARINAGQTAEVQIVNPDLSQTARIEIRKLP